MASAEATSSSTDFFRRVESLDLRFRAARQRSSARELTAAVSTLLRLSRLFPGHTSPPALTGPLIAAPAPSQSPARRRKNVVVHRAMKINILATAAALSDQELLAHLAALAGRERETLVELLAHLIALDDRPGVYSAQGYGSLYTYCTQALRFSEDAACTRIEVARTCRRFPVILDLLGSGEMTLTSVRRLAGHLTPENHQRVLERARRRTREEIDALVAELDPRPDARFLLRRLPTCPAPALALPPIASGASSDPAATIATPQAAL